MKKEDLKIPSVFERLPHLVAMTKDPENGVVSIKSVECVTHKLVNLVVNPNIYVVRHYGQEFC